MNEDLNQYFDAARVETRGGSTHIWLRDAATATENALKRATVGKSQSSGGTVIYLQDESGQVFHYRTLLDDTKAAQALFDKLFQLSLQCDEANGRALPKD